MDEVLNLHLVPISFALVFVSLNISNSGGFSTHDSIWMNFKIFICSFVFALVFVSYEMLKNCSGFLTHASIRMKFEICVWYSFNLIFIFLNTGNQSSQIPHS